MSGGKKTMDITNACLAFDTRSGDARPQAAQVKVTLM
jgi:hypothetical protein